jgi:hypothetical protein
MIYLLTLKLDSFFHEIHRFGSGRDIRLLTYTVSYWHKSVNALLISSLLWGFSLMANCPCNTHIWVLIVKIEEFTKILSRFRSILSNAHKWTWTLVMCGNTWHHLKVNRIVLSKNLCFFEIILRNWHTFTLRKNRRKSKHFMLVCFQNRLLLDFLIITVSCTLMHCCIFVSFF